MKKIFLAILVALFLGSLNAQVKPVHPTDIVKGEYHGVSKPLRDIPPMTAQEFHQLELKGLKRTLNKDLKNRIYPFAESALPKGKDNFRQDVMGTNGNRSPLLNFDGQTSPYMPPDCNGTAGPNHFMQTINCVYAIYDKSGTLVAGPTDLNLLFGNVPGANRNDGDPIILYDEQADRWFVTEFSIPYTGPNYILLAVSTTNDPTGTWHQYSFQVASMPDYPKFSVWQDGYYMGDNNTSGNDIYVFEREKILAGQPAQAVGFNNPWRPTSVDGFMCVPPIDNDGTFAPTGTPGLFIAHNDDALGGGTDQLWLYELDVDWTTPANSTFVRSQQIDVQPFNSNFGNNWNNIEQKGTNQRVDAIPQVIMNVPQYRNFGAQQTIICCHTINMDGVRHAGIRWYELEKTTGNWTVRQQGTYSPDAHSRWNGSIAMNGSKEIGLGYSVSSTSINPGILFCGQSAGENANATGVLDIAEDTILVGAYSQNGGNRWGDYSQVSVDPADDKTFWFTTQYIGSGGSKKTRIASFRYDFAPLAVTIPATGVTSSAATLNGSINPNGLATDYHFEYGLTPVALTNSTPTVPAGSGTVNMDVSANISGLQENTMYYFRVVAESTGGVTSGQKVKFTTQAAPFLNVTPPDQPVDSHAGATSFDVVSNIGWNALSNAEWCTVTSAGSGSDTIFAVYQENPGAATRVANITVSGIGVVSRDVTVTQAGMAPTISVTPPNRQVAPEAGSTAFDVVSNTMWTVQPGSTWCTATQGGAGNGIIQVSFEANPMALPRICELSVTASGLSPVIVTVTQSGAAPMLSVTPLNRNVPYEAGSATFDVASNSNWTVASNASWCVITPSGSGNGIITVGYPENGADQPRVADISVSVQGLPDQIVTLTQAKSSLGIGEKDLSSIQILPNPNSGHFRIVVPSSYNTELVVRILDMDGREILVRTCKNENDYSFDLSGVARGTYHVVMRTSSTVSTKKLVVF